MKTGLCFLCNSYLSFLQSKLKTKSLREIKRAICSTLCTPAVNSGSSAKQMWLRDRKGINVESSSVLLTLQAACGNDALTRTTLF